MPESLEVGSMYQIALGGMGPRLSVRIVQTTGIHKMEISLQDSSGLGSMLIT